MKNGEIIVCISIKRNTLYAIESELNNLTIGKFYKVLDSSIFDDGFNMVLICNDNGRVRHYTYSGRFVSLKEYRKQ